MKTVLTARAAEDYRYWQDNDPKKFERVRQLIKALYADAFVGIGKPEPLKHKRPLWSRRIDREHRLVYYVKDGEIVIIACRFHYTSI